jgi:hypothetical protein
VFSELVDRMCRELGVSVAELRQLKRQKSNQHNRWTLPFRFQN